LEPLGGRTVADLPSEGVVVLASGTLWQVPWELMMLGPFTSCGLLDGEFIRHVTVPAMVASAVRQSACPGGVLAPSDYPKLPVFAADMRVVDAALLVVETGWDLAVVMDREPRVITARTVYRALVGTGARTSRPSVCSPIDESGQRRERREVDLVGLGVMHGADL
jgi:hypothetical protein